MNRKRLTKQQMLYALHQADSGTPLFEFVRKLVVSERIFYRWKKPYAGLGNGELSRLKSLEAENFKLKALLADLSLDKQILKIVLAKKV